MLAPLLAAVLVAAYLVQTVWQVWPFLFLSPGDFGHFHRAAVSMLAGGSAFAHPELDYPPLVLVLVLPLGALPLAAARVVWYALGQAALLAAAIATWRLLGRDRIAAGGVLAVWTVAGTTAENLGLGQLNPLVLALVASALAAPSGGAVAVGLATGLKVWPGLLLTVPVLTGLPTPPDSTARRRLGLGLLTVVLAGVMPWLALVVATPPPHAAQSHGYWLGTPASLSFSLPSAALRAGYDWVASTPVPSDWQASNVATFVLSPGRRALSVAISLATLACGFAFLAWRLRVARRPGRATTGNSHRDASLALIALAVVASPISWYHYQLFQLPALAVAADGAWRERAWGRLVGVAAVGLALTRTALWRQAFALLGADADLALYRTGIAVPWLGLAWFCWLAWRVGRVGAARQ
jgi:hypothetical protein